jgi:hypothetical protein
MKRTLTGVAIVAICLAVQVEAMFNWSGSSKKAQANKDTYDIETNQELYRAYREMKGQNVGSRSSHWLSTVFNSPQEVEQVIEKGYQGYIKDYIDVESPQVALYNPSTSQAEEFGLNDMAKKKLIKDLKTIENALAAGAIDLGQAHIRKTDAIHDAAILSNPTRTAELQDIKKSEHRENMITLKESNIRGITFKIGALKRELAAVRNARKDAEKMDDADLAQEMADEAGRLKNRIVELEALKAKTEGTDYLNQAIEQGAGLLGKLNEAAKSSGLADILK